MDRTNPLLAMLAADQAAMQTAADGHQPGYDRAQASDLASLCYGHLSHKQVAGMVRMLMRDSLCHESVLTAARDRIAWLAKRVEMLEAEAAAREGDPAAARMRDAAPALYAALQDASGHLDFIGYGDSYEREAADIAGLPEKIQAALDAAVPPPPPPAATARLISLPRVRCAACGKKFRTEKDLNQHERDRHAAARGEAS